MNNPFIKRGATYGLDGTLRWTLAGYTVCSTGIGDHQQTARKVLYAEKVKGWPTLRGKNLACWCALDKPCHADVLLHVVNRKTGSRRFDLNGYLAKRGWRIDMGKAVRI